MAYTIQVRGQNSPKTLWDVAPGDHEIYSREEIKPMYRKAVEQYLPTADKSLMRKPFFTIATNCAGPVIDFTRQKQGLDDSLVDMYLPLEISITKWTIRDAKLNRKARKLETRNWIVNPGEVHYTLRKYSRLNADLHKIQINDMEDVDNPYIEDDLVKIVKEINSFLTQDRVVFSQNIQSIRQDLGCLKWLSYEMQNHGIQFKPISVLNLSDLYVHLIKRFNPEANVGDGIARYRLDGATSYNHCDYHKNLERTGVSSAFCARAISIGKSQRMLFDLKLLGDLFLKNEADGA